MKGATLAQALAGGVSPAIMQLGDRAHEGQPDPQPARHRMTRALRLREHPENLLQVRRVDADPIIRHAYPHPFRDALHIEGNLPASCRYTLPHWITDWKKPASAGSGRH